MPQRPSQGTTEDTIFRQGAGRDMEQLFYVYSSNRVCDGANFMAPITNGTDATTYYYARTYVGSARHPLRPSRHRGAASLTHHRHEKKDIR